MIILKNAWTAALHVVLGRGRHTPGFSFSSLDQLGVKKVYLSPCQTLRHHWSNDETEEEEAKVAKRKPSFISPAHTVWKRGSLWTWSQPQDGWWEGRRLPVTGRGEVFCILTVPKNNCKKKQHEFLPAVQTQLHIPALIKIFQNKCPPTWDI